MHDMRAQFFSRANTYCICMRGYTAFRLLRRNSASSRQLRPKMWQHRKYWFAPRLLMFSMVAKAQPKSSSSWLSIDEDLLQIGWALHHFVSCSSLLILGVLAFGTCGNYHDHEAIKINEDLFCSNLMRIWDRHMASHGSLGFDTRQLCPEVGAPVC